MKNPPKITPRLEPARATSSALSTTCPAAKSSEVVIGVPVADLGPDVYCMRRVDIDVSLRQAKAMRLAFDGLQLAGETVQMPGISSPRPVTRPTDAIRYMLDQLADEYGLPA